MDDLTGTRLNDYQLLRLLGRGAMATVYLADQASLSRRVAVKVLSAELGRSESAVDRFRHEARAAAALVHANIVQVYEVGRWEDRHYLAQEYVPGGTLGDFVGREGRVAPEKALAVLWQVGAALAAAADRGVVHRDIKPDNLMVDRSGVIKVADFGLARTIEPGSPRLTQEGLTMGTPLYMSPEQVEGKPLDPRSDLYSLGATVYHLAVGAPPFDGDTPLAVAARRLHEDPAPVATRRPDLPGELARVIDRLMRRSPDERYASAAELLADLRVVLRAAEQEGWAGEADLDSSRVGAALSGEAAADRGLTDRLGAAMREESGRRSSSGARSFWGVIALGLLAGAAIGWSVSGDPLVPRTPETVQREATVQAQLYRAKVVGTPEAWDAVERYFPDAAEFYHLLALRGYAADRLVAGEPSAALPALERLAARQGEFPELAQFGQAGMVVALTQLGEEQRARTALGAMNANPERALREQSPELASALARAVRRLNGQPR